MRILFVAKDLPKVREFTSLVQELGIFVDEVGSPIEANDAVLASIARERPIHVIFLHEDHDQEESLDLVRYWRGQNPFLPIILVRENKQQKQEDSSGSLWQRGYFGVVYLDDTVGQQKEGLIRLRAYTEINETYKLKAELLEAPARCSELNRALLMAIKKTATVFANVGVAFVLYSPAENEPITQFSENLALYSQIWLDQVCENAERDLEPVLRSGRMQFQGLEHFRYIYPIITDSGWEGFLIFSGEEEADFDSSFAARCTIVAEGFVSLIDHVRMRLKLVKMKQNKAEYISILSNNLKSPLSDVKSSSDLLYMMDTEPHIKELASKLARDSQISHEVLDNVLELARIDQGMVVLHARQIALDPLIEDVVERLAGLFREKNIHVVIQSENKEHFVINGDPEKLKKVFSNLLTNAATFSGQDSTVTINLKKDEDHCVLVSVADEGPGLLPEQKDDIFERSGEESGGIITGKGIGLYICKKFINVHEGQIWAESHFGLGATFHVRLPFTR